MKGNLTGFTQDVFNFILELKTVFKVSKQISQIYNHVVVFKIRDIKTTTSTTVIMKLKQVIAILTLHTCFCHQGKLVLTNGEDGTEHHFRLKGEGQKPLALDNVVLECEARKS